VTLNPDGTGVAAITSDDMSMRPKWSADGTKIAFERVRREGPPFYYPLDVDIQTMNFDGSGVMRLTDEAFWDRAPSWSPDGTKLIFSRTRNGDDDLYTISADGTGTTQITNGPGHDLDPVWSPLGDQIAFRSFDPDPLHIYVARADGSGRRQLESSVEGQIDPDWSSDGRRITFGSYLTRQIYSIGADGTGLVQLTSDPYTPSLAATNSGPAWSPDGTKIVFVHSECYGTAGCHGWLETIRPDGTGRTTLARLEDQYDLYEPDWQPLPGPQRGDYKNAAQFCKAERDFFGDETFRNRYGGGANAYGKCVSGGR
jgi:TolB protein